MNTGDVLNIAIALGIGFMGAVLVTVGSVFSRYLWARRPPNASFVRRAVRWLVILLGLAALGSIWCLLAFRHLFIPSTGLSQYLLVMFAFVSGTLWFASFGLLEDIHWS